MRDILEVIERLDASIEAALEVPSGARWSAHMRAAKAAGDAWEEYTGIMLALEPPERSLVDPTWPYRWVAAQNLEAVRRDLYAQQTENIRAAWAAREEGGA